MENGSLQTQTPGIDPQWPTVSLMFGKDTAKWPFPAVVTGKQHHGPRRKLPLRHFPEGAKPIPPFVWRNMIFPANEESAWIFIMSSTKREREGWFSAMKTARPPLPHQPCGGGTLRCADGWSAFSTFAPAPNWWHGNGISYSARAAYRRWPMCNAHFSIWMINFAGAGCLWRSSAGTEFVFGGAFFFFLSRAVGAFSGGATASIILWRPETERYKIRIVFTRFVSWVILQIVLLSLFRHRWKAGGTGSLRGHPQQLSKLGGS